MPPNHWTFMALHQFIIFLNFNTKIWLDETGCCMLEWWSVPCPECSSTILLKDKKTCSNTFKEHLKTSTEPKKYTPWWLYKDQKWRYRLQMCCRSIGRVGVWLLLTSIKTARLKHALDYRKKQHHTWSCSPISSSLVAVLPVRICPRTARTASTSVWLMPVGSCCRTCAFSSAVSSTLPCLYMHMHDDAHDAHHKNNSLH